MAVTSGEADGYTKPAAATADVDIEPYLKQQQQNRQTTTVTTTGTDSPGGGGQMATSAGTSASNSQAQSSDTLETTAKGLGGDPQFWYDKDIDQYYAVYFIEDQDPPIPIMWTIPDKEALEAFGGGKTPKIHKKLSSKDMDSTGAIVFGSTDNLPDSELDPLNGFYERMERAAETQPWLSDPEVMALLGAAYIEGRALESWELDKTEWFSSRNTEQRKWAGLIMSDPETAEQEITSDRIKVSAMFDSIGAAGNDPALIDWMAQRYTMGDWSEETLAQQVEAVTSGWTDVDSQLETWLKSEKVSAVESIDKTDDVRDLYNKWLGPAYPPNDDEIAAWAVKFRNDPSAVEQLTDTLRNQRVILYSAYEDPNLTYQDIAAPWRGVVSNVWGQTPDEASDTFQQIIRLNDYGEANKILRREGLDQNIDKVWDDATKASSGNVRRAL